jgi:hypothetical protein
MPITGRDEERDALAMFVGDYIDFRQSDRVTADLNQNRVFREYALRLTDTRTTDELIATALEITKENFANYQQQEAFRANPETASAPAKDPLSLTELRQLFLYASPAGVTKAAAGQMRSVLLSTVFGKDKSDRVQLLAKGLLQPSPALAKLLQNLETRTTLAAINHFYASLQNPNPDRPNPFNLYEAHRSLPQFEKDFLHQHALKAKYDSLKDQQQTRTVTPDLVHQTNEPSVAAAAKATDSYRAYYGQADWREATLCASALAQQEGLSRADLDRHTLTVNVSDLEARAINYAVHNFDQTRQAQVVQHLRGSDDRHTQTLGDMLALAAEAHHAGAATKEITTADLTLPSNYPLSAEDAEKVINFAVQPPTLSLQPETLATARETAQHETWNSLQASLISDPGLFVDAPATTLAEARELQQLIHSAAELQDRARTAFAIRAEHSKSLEKETPAIESSRTNSDYERPSSQPLLSATSKGTHPHPVQTSRNGASQPNQSQPDRGRPISQSDTQKSELLEKYAIAARNDYLRTFSKIDSGRIALQNTQSLLAEQIAGRYEQGAQGSSNANTRYATVKENIERGLLGEHLAQALSSPGNLDLNTQDLSGRDLLPPDVLAQTAATAREEAWQSFEPQEIRDAQAGVTVDERILTAAYEMMDHVDTARSLETNSAEAQQLEQAFQQIDEAIDRLEITKAEVRMEQQLAPYQQIAQPVAERVNNYLKETTKDDGLRAILDPARHQSHVDKITLTILQTARECNVKFDRSTAFNAVADGMKSSHDSMLKEIGLTADSLSQVQQVASTLFTALRDGMERANQHLLQGPQVTTDLYRNDLAQQPHQHDLLHSHMNGHHQLETLRTDKASNTHSPSDRLLDLTKTDDPSKELQELDDPTHTSDLAESQSLNNSGPQNSVLAQNQPAQEEVSHVLEMIL